MPEGKTLGDRGLPIALCRFYLKNGTWTPLAMNTELSSKHRSGPSDDVIYCEVRAAIDGPKIVGMSKPIFSCRRVLKDGTLEPIDFQHAADALDAWGRDAAARASGAIGITRKSCNAEGIPRVGSHPKHSISQLSELPLT